MTAAWEYDSVRQEQLIQARPWKRFLRMSGDPLVPPFQEALQQALSTQEADELARHLRPLVESGTGLERTALAYLTAIKGWKEPGCNHNRWRTSRQLRCQQS